MQNKFERIVDWWWHVKADDDNDHHDNEKNYKILSCLSSGWSSQLGHRAFTHLPDNSECQLWKIGKIPVKGDEERKKKLMDVWQAHVQAQNAITTTNTILTCLIHQDSDAEYIVTQKHIKPWAIQISGKSDQALDKVNVHMISSRTYATVTTNVTLCLSVHEDSGYPTFRSKGPWKHHEKRSSFDIANVHMTVQGYNFTALQSTSSDCRMYNYMRGKGPSTTKRSGRKGDQDSDKANAFLCLYLKKKKKKKKKNFSFDTGHCTQHMLQLMQLPLSAFLATMIQNTGFIFRLRVRVGSSIWHSMSLHCK